MHAPTMTEAAVPDTYVTAPDPVSAAERGYAREGRFFCHF
jgi:hypothetical protein